LELAVNKRELVAVALAGVYPGACVWALWDRLDAVLLLAVASPVAVSFIFPKGTNKITRTLIGASIDAFLSALAFVPVMGDLVDVGASVVALVLLIMRFKQFAASLPGGLACVILYAFLWFEASLLPHGLSVSVYHPFWYYPVVIVAVMLIGAAVIVVLSRLLALLYDGDRPHAIFRTIGFPWYLIIFFLTIFLPDRDVKRAHQAAEISRRSDY
jgi:hypothetical protein